ncbi:MAG: hypothetical protein VB104_02635 [Candidatus Limiplasma sp.]|nr:hypothetical protein [Candidatus Limiplasma sp.]
MRDKPIVYIAGCLDTQADRTMTFVAKVQLESRGFAVIEEYDLPREKGLTPVELHRFGNTALGVADIVCFLPNWELNPSATLERVRCRHWCKTAMDYDELLRRNDQMQDF